jgi:hypothetical protein
MGSCSSLPVTHKEDLKYDFLIQQVLLFDCEGIRLAARKLDHNLVDYPVIFFIIDLAFLYEPPRYSWVPVPLRQYLVHLGHASTLNLLEPVGADQPFATAATQLPWLWRDAVVFRESPTAEHISAVVGALRPSATSFVQFGDKVGPLADKVLATGDAVGYNPRQGALSLRSGLTNETAFVVVTHRCAQRGQVWVQVAGFDSVLAPMSELLDVIQSASPPLDLVEDDSELPTTSASSSVIDFLSLTDRRLDSLLGNSPGGL